MNFNYLGNPDLAIRVYKTNLNQSLSTKLNMCLQNEQSCNKWSLALVGYEQTPDSSYRNCWDFKINDSLLEGAQQEIVDVYEKTTEEIRRCVDDYSQTYNISMKFMEAVNFVKYETGEHFSYHTDHGFHYVCTVSTVAYFNDDYLGGDLHFDKFDLKLKPVAGDVIVFPSSFMYSHASMPVLGGTKYAAVTMFDYDNEYSKWRLSKDYKI